MEQVQKTHLLRKHYKTVLDQVEFILPKVIQLSGALVGVLLHECQVLALNVLHCLTLER